MKRAHEQTEAEKRAASITAATLAERWKIPRQRVEHWCSHGAFRGVWFDRLTWQWRIPLRIVVAR
jgi:hypothetical protein